MKYPTLLVIVLVLSLQGFSQKSNKPKIQAIYNAIKAADIRHADFVMAQCIQETGWLNCKSCCYRFNNLFGFVGRGTICRKFISDSASIAYYKKWQDKRYDKWRKKFPKSDYYHFLKHIKYATGDKYNNEIRPHLAWVRKNLVL